MAKTLADWVATEVHPHRDKPLSWLSEQHFFRDPLRPAYSDASVFFSPADGTILYQMVVEPTEAIVDIKGKAYSLQDALFDSTYNQKSIVASIFMAGWDVHINRIPYSGRLSYRLLDPIATYNHSMLDMERAILEEVEHLPLEEATYMRHNQRMVNRIDSTQLGQSYYIIQIADYEVNCVTPFELRQNWPCLQGQRFSAIRFGSELTVIIPCSPHYDFVPMQSVGMHVEAGVDPIFQVQPKGHTG